ncbi:hypothetical protein ACHQM5_030843 [Ranunculus cassubicifolius]
MITSYSLSFILLFTTLLSVLTFTRAVTHDVGDQDGWTEFPNFDTWAEGRTFHVGDRLLFNYVPELHNVIQVDENGYNECRSDPNMGLLQTGNDYIDLTTVGTFWYICSIDQHCGNGQKLSVTVVP